MKKLIVFVCAILALFCDAQTFPVIVKTEPGLKLQMLVRTLEGPNYDTFYQSPVFTESLVAEIAVPPYLGNGAHMPLLFSLIDQHQNTVSGLMIDDTTYFNVVRSELGIATYPILGESQQWLSDILNPENKLFAALLENDTSLEKDAMDIFLKDINSKNFEIKAFLLFTCLTKNIFSATNYPTIKQTLMTFPTGKWPARAIDLIEQRMDQNECLESFRFLTYDKQESELDSFLNKDYVLIDFWASWCAPCITAMEHLKEVYPRYRDKANILALSIDNTSQAWEKASQKLQLPWTSAYDHAELSRRIQTRLSVTAIPYYILIDNNRKILYRGNDLEEALKFIK